MNDFTKEELVIILLEMNIVIQRTNKQGILKISPIYFELRDKIQSMIDNYCEHEKATTIHPGDTVLICNQCETILSPWNLRKYQP